MGDSVDRARLRLPARLRLEDVRVLRDGLELRVRMPLKLSLSVPSSNRLRAEQVLLLLAARDGGEWRVVRRKLTALRGVGPREPRRLL